jgi:redox-sensitive bicupin YhaK (pirin superfamily)
VPVRHEGDAIVRVLVGQGSPVELGTPRLILDVELPTGGTFSRRLPSDSNGFIYVLEGEASLGSNRRLAGRSQIGCSRTRGRGHYRCAARDAIFMLTAGRPYGEKPVYNGPYVD